MSEKKAQQHIEQVTTSAEHLHASFQHVNSAKKAQPPMRDSPRVFQVLNQLLDLLIRGACLWGGIVGFLRTSNELFFLLCMGVAYREIGIYAAIQMVTSTLIQVTRRNSASPGVPPAEENQEEPKVIE